jgi:hypothetical protein
MGPDRNTHLRNIAILLLLAVAVWQVPGGDEGGATVAALLLIVLWGGLLFFAYRMYMEHRLTLFGWDDRQRGLLYGSLGLAAITLIATGRMWDEGGLGALAWFALIFLAGSGVYRVVRAVREY